MNCDEVLKAVFPYLDGVGLASCMGVCKRWRNIARDDFFWKCLCAKRWPSMCKQPNPPTVTFYKLYQTFNKRKQHKTLLPPRISFDDLEFFIDIWTEEGFIFSEVVPGPVLQNVIKIPPPEGFIFSEVVPGPVLQNVIKIPPPGASDMLKFHLEGPEYRMKLPVDPRCTVPVSQTVSISVLVGRKDSNRVACIINKSMFDYIDRSAYRAMANDYLEFSPVYPFVSGIRAWVSLLFMEEGNEGAIDVFGIEMDFCDAANSEEEVLWLLDMLDWK